MLVNTLIVLLSILLFILPIAAGWMIVQKGTGHEGNKTTFAKHFATGFLCTVSVYALFILILIGITVFMIAACIASCIWIYTLINDEKYYYKKARNNEKSTELIVPLRAGAVSALAFVTPVLYLSGTDLFLLKIIHQFMIIFIAVFIIVKAVCYFFD